MPVTHYVFVRHIYYLIVSQQHSKKSYCGCSYFIDKENTDTERLNQLEDNLQMNDIVRMRAWESDSRVGVVKYHFEALEFIGRKERKKRLYKRPGIEMCFGGFGQRL